MSWLVWCWPSLAPHASLVIPSPNKTTPHQGTKDDLDATVREIKRRAKATSDSYSSSKNVLTVAPAFVSPYHRLPLPPHAFPERPYGLSKDVTTTAMVMQLMDPNLLASGTIDMRG